MPLAASKRRDAQDEDEFKSCNRPNAACGIETMKFYSEKSESEDVATDLMPLAAYH